MPPTQDGQSSVTLCYETSCSRVSPLGYAVVPQVLSLMGITDSLYRYTQDLLTFEPHHLSSPLLGAPVAPPLSG